MADDVRELRQVSENMDALLAKIRALGDHAITLSREVLRLREENAEQKKEIDALKAKCESPAHE